jgi:hypothetical protein
MLATDDIVLAVGYARAPRSRAWRLRVPRLDGTFLPEQRALGNWSSG